MVLLLWLVGVDEKERVALVLGANNGRDAHDVEGCSDKDGNELVVRIERRAMRRSACMATASVWSVPEGPLVFRRDHHS